MCCCNTKSSRAIVPSRVLRARLAAADPRHLGRGDLARRPRARGRRREPVRGVRGDAGRAGAAGRRDPARRPRPLPLLRGARAALRRARRSPRSRSTTSDGPPGSSKRGDEFEYMEHVQQTTPAGVQADMAAAVAHLRPSCQLDLHRRLLLRRAQLVARGGERPRPRGRDRVLREPGLAGGRRRGRRSAPARWSARSSRSRPATTRTSRPRRTRRSTRRSTAAGVEHELVTYEGAPHSFFDRS